MKTLLVLAFLPLTHCCRFTFSKLWTIRDCYPYVPVREEPWLFTILIVAALIAFFAAIYLRNILPFSWNTDDLLDYPILPQPNVIPLQNLLPNLPDLLDQLPPNPDPPRSPSTCSYFRFTNE